MKEEKKQIYSAVPCPFCGGTSLRLVSCHETLSARAEVFVSCLSCSARGPVVNYARHSGLTDKYKLNAVGYWNECRIIRQNKEKRKK